MKINFTSPLFALGYCDKVVPASEPNLRFVKTRRDSSPVYSNETCYRCPNPKALATKTMACTECEKLPTCDICGEVEPDCCCEPDYDPCLGCENGCGECLNDRGYYNADRERWGYDG